MEKQTEKKVFKALFLIGVISINLSLLIYAVVPRILHIWLSTTSIEMINGKFNMEVLYPSIWVLVLVSIVEVVIGFFGLFVVPRMDNIN